MKIEPINRNVSLTPTQRDAIVKSLVSKGIDAKLVHSVLGPVADGCCNGYGPYGCPKFIVCEPDAVNKLKKEISAKGIKLTDIDPAVVKLLK